MKAGELLYTYCFTYGEITKLEDITNIAGETGCFLLGKENVNAVVSHVHIDQFGEQALAARLKDSDWLKQKVQDHEYVVEQIMAEGPVIPLKFGTIFQGAQPILDFLSAHAQTLAETLDRLTGRQEWAVKMYCDKELFMQQLMSGQPEEAVSGSGVGYLQGKLRAKLLQEKADRASEKIAGELFGQLKAFSDSWVINECWGSEVTGRQETMIANIVFLLPASQVAGFCQTVEDFEARVRYCGIILEASGPWPPYHFAAFPEENHA